MTEPTQQLPLALVAALSDLGPLSERMGLQWGLRYATVVDLDPPVGNYDGDLTGTVPVPLIPLGIDLGLGHRCAVLFVPPAGNYAISNLTTRNLPSQSSVYAAPDGQTRSSAGFADILVGGQPLTMSFTKYASDSRIAVHHSMSGYLTGALGTILLAGIAINGIDYPTAQQYFNVAGSHMGFSADTHIPRPDLGEDPIAAGEYEVTMRWSRSAGTGTVNVDNIGDIVSCLLVEAPPA